MNAQQILTVATFGASCRQLFEMIEADIAEPQRDLFRTGDAESLTLFKDLDKMAGLDQQLMRAGIQPGKTAPKDFDEKIPALEVGAVQIGDFQLATWRRL